MHRLWPIFDYHRAHWMDVPLTFFKHSSTCWAISSGVRCKRPWHTGQEWHALFRIESPNSDSESPFRFRVLALKRPCRFVRMRWNVWCVRKTYEERIVQRRLDVFVLKVPFPTDFYTSIFKFHSECNWPPSDCPVPASFHYSGACLDSNWNWRESVVAPAPNSICRADPIRPRNVSPIRLATAEFHILDMNLVAEYPMLASSFQCLQMTNECVEWKLCLKMWM